MRFAPGELPEIIDVQKRDGLHFAWIRLVRSDEDRVFELGISASSFAALKRVLQARPFDDMPGLSRRFFFVPSYSKRDDPDKCIGTIRVEQGSIGRNIEFEMPQTLIANLLWFYDMTTHEPARHLRSWDFQETSS
jgi:hypothetical protein